MGGVWWALTGLVGGFLSTRNFARMLRAMPESSSESKSGRLKEFGWGGVAAGGVGGRDSGGPDVDLAATEAAVGVEDG